MPFMFTVAITPPVTLPHETAWALAMLEAGVSRLHVRKPECDAHRVASYLEPLVGAGFAHRLVVHGHHMTALEMGVRCLHFTAAMRCAHAEGEYSSCGRTTSTHSVQELLGLDAGWDYAFLSPIFPSISKPGYQGHFSAHELRAATQQDLCRVVALGGIDENTLPQLPGLGFHGVAMLGALWQQPRIESALQLLRQSLAL